MIKTKTKIGIGITGGIAAYKIADLVSRLTKKGFEVHVIMTENATHFITPLTIKTLSNNPVLVDMFDVSSPWRVQHIAIAQEIELMVVAPATANLIAKMTCGLADDLLSTVILATQAPILIVPSMNTNMYTNPVVQQNLDCLRSRGHEVLEPEAGELACGVTGQGRLPEIETIYNKILSMLAVKQDLLGQTLLVTSGATQEDIDPVRFITNRSTGKMGFALASEAAQRGARVILVSGFSTLPDPPGVEVFRVRSARQMFECCMKFFEEVDVVIAAAAVADYRPAEYQEQKIKKADDDLIIRLERNPDILGTMGMNKKGQMLVGFAAETNDVMANGLAKLHKKNLDLLVINDITKAGAGFGSDTNIVTLVTRDGSVHPLSQMPKMQVAKIIIDQIVKLKSRENI